MEITWTGNASFYQMRLREVGVNDWFVSGGPQPINSFPANFYTTYEIQVRGVCNPGDTSLWSDIKVIEVGAPGPCPLPRFSELLQVWDKGAWFNVEGDQTEIRYSKRDSVFWKNDVQPIYGGKVVGGLDSATSYMWQSRKICSWGDSSEWSDTLRFMTSCEPMVTTSGYYKDSSDIQWVGGSGKYEYMLLSYPEGDTIKVDTISGNHIKLDTLEGSYEFLILSICDDETRSLRDTGFYHGNTCYRPKDRIAEGTAYSTRFKWTGSSYKYQFKIAEFDSEEWKYVMTTIPKITIDTLQIGKKYKWDVRTICSGGDTSFWSGEGEYIVPEIAPCPLREILDTKYIYATSARLTWDNDNNMENYPASIIRYSKKDPVDWKHAEVNTNNFLVLDNLDPLTEYMWQVQTACAQGDSSAWSDVTYFTTDCSGPITPIEVNFSGNSVVINWANVAPSYYYVIVNTSTGDTIKKGVVSGGELIFSDLPYGDYEFSISGPCDDGNYSIPDRKSFSFKDGTGINEFAVSSSAHIVPNPSKGAVTITAGFKMNSVEIYEISGRQLYSESANGFTHFLNVSFASGVYLIKIKGEKAQQNLRLIKE